MLHGPSSKWPKKLTVKGDPAPAAPVSLKTSQSLKTGEPKVTPGEGTPSLIKPLLANDGATSLLEPLPLLTLEPIPQVTSVERARSVVTNAVVGTGPLELHSLPPELLQTTFSMLDRTSLCRLAQVSIGCRELADDPQVWHALCGHCKEYERAWSLSVQARRREQAAREALARKLWKRQWKRRVLGVTQALCGIAFILLPLVLLLKRGGGGGAAAAAPTIWGGDLPAVPDDAARAHAALRYDELVWNAVGHSCGGGGAGAAQGQR
jgi:hypothetical protein